MRNARNKMPKTRLAMKTITRTVTYQKLRKGTLFTALFVVNIINIIGLFEFAQLAGHALQAQSESILQLVLNRFLSDCLFFAKYPFASRYSAQSKSE